MGRIARFVRSDRPTVYHVVSRTALPGRPITAQDKDYLLGLIRKLSTLYCSDILGFCVMGNHFHLVCRMYPGSEVSDAEIQRRCKAYYGEDQMIAGEHLESYRERLTSLGAFIKDIKQGFTRYYNRRTGRKGSTKGQAHSLPKVATLLSFLKNQLNQSAKEELWVGLPGLCAATGRQSIMWSAGQPFQGGPSQPRTRTICWV